MLKSIKAFIDGKMQPSNTRFSNEKHIKFQCNTDNFRDDLCSFQHTIVTKIACQLHLSIEYVQHKQFNEFLFSFFFSYFRMKMIDYI